MTPEVGKTLTGRVPVVMAEADTFVATLEPCEGGMYVNAFNTGNNGVVDAA
jgi:hypothetical protein